MKKYILPIAAMLMLGACSQKADTTENSTTTEAAAEDAAVVTFEDAVAGEIFELDSDDIIRPGDRFEGMVIADFNATWCGPCKMLHPVFEAAAKAHSDITFVSIDIDHCPETAKAFGVEAVPTVIIFKADGSSKTFVGTEDLLPAEKFEALIAE